MAKCGYCGAKAKGPDAIKGRVIKHDTQGRVCASAEGFCSAKCLGEWELARVPALGWAVLPRRDLWTHTPPRLLDMGFETIEGAQDELQ